MFLFLQAFSRLRLGSHAILRYRCGAPVSSGAPVAQAASFVQVYYYSSSNPVFGSDSPLDTETFRDSLSSQSGQYAGWTQSTHLLSIPQGTQTTLLVIGADPLLFQGSAGLMAGGSLCYSDVWICDEAITRIFDSVLPIPSSTQMRGPGKNNSISSHVHEDSADSTLLAIGNETGALLISDIWVTLAQPSPSIESSDVWDLDTPQDFRPSQDGILGPSQDGISTAPPYALSLPSELPAGRAARDPLLLHQARYAGRGAEETDVSLDRFRGKSARQPSTSKSIRGKNGLPSSPLSRKGRVTAEPAVGHGGFWKGATAEEDIDPGLYPVESGLAARFKNLYSTLASLARARSAPPARALRLLAALSDTPVTPASTGSLYVYAMGLSSLSLLRHEYAPSGLYVTKPLRSIDGSSLAAEIHEVSVVTSPPLSTLQSRVRLWVVPDKNSAGTDSPAAQLARAIPLDSKTPRVTFHSAIESLPGLSPAVSDTALSLGVSPPAFYVTPSIITQVLNDGLDPDTAAQGLRLDYIPYINREAIFHIAYAIAAGNATNPNVYDPNAVRPIIDFLSNFDSGFVSSTTTQNDPTAHVEPGSINTVSLPFLDIDQNAVDMVMPYSVTFTVTKQPEGIAALNTLAVPQLILNGDGTVSANFVAPQLEGDYSFDAVASAPRNESESMQSGIYLPTPSLTLPWASRSSNTWRHPQPSDSYAGQRQPES